MSQFPFGLHENTNRPEDYPDLKIQALIYDRSFGTGDLLVTDEGVFRLTLTEAAAKRQELAAQPDEKWLKIPGPAGNLHLVNIDSIDDCGIGSHTDDIHFGLQSSRAPGIRFATSISLDTPEPGYSYGQVLRWQKNAVRQLQQKDPRFVGLEGIETQQSRLGTAFGSAILAVTQLVPAIIANPAKAPRAISQFTAAATDEFLHPDRTQGVYARKEDFRDVSLDADRVKFTIAHNGSSCETSIAFASGSQARQAFEKFDAALRP